MLENPEALKSKVEEAVAVLQAHNAKISISGGPAGAPAVPGR